MKCSCPKCKADITEEFSEIPDEGIFLVCPQCHVNFNLKGESFARRALRKEIEITCAECGNEPGPSIYCQNCHAVYPDYLITETSSAAKKQFGKISSLLKAFNRSTVKTPTAAVGQVQQKQVPIKGIKLPGKPLQLAATLLVLVALIGGSGVYYYLDKIESEYMSKYINVLLVLVTSEEYNNKVCDRISADWKAGNFAAAPKPTDTEQTFLSRGAKEADAVIKNMGDPPKKFVQSNASMMELSGIYKKHLAMATAPAGTAESFAASSIKLNEEFSKGTSTLKTKLPAKLSEKLAASKSKYKQLQNF